MTKEDLFEAIGGIEDDVLILGDAAASGQNNVTGILSRQKTEKRFSLNAKRYAAAAACLIVVALGAIVFKGISSKWRMGSSALNNAMQTEGVMIEEASEAEVYDTYNMSSAADKSINYGIFSELDYLITSNVAIGVSTPDMDEGQVLVSEETRNLILGSLEPEETAEEDDVNEGSALESMDRAAVPASGVQPTTETAQPDATALYILTFEQFDTTYVATLFDNRTLVFEDETMDVIVLSEEEFNRLVSMLQNEK